MRLKDFLNEQAPPWMNQAEARKSKVNVLDAEIERLRQTILNCKRQILEKKEAKRRTQPPPPTI